MVIWNAHRFKREVRVLLDAELIHLPRPNACGSVKLNRPATTEDLLNKT